MTAHPEPRLEDKAVSHLLKPILNPDESAEYLRVSKSTLLKWTREGGVPHRRINQRKLFYKRKEIDEWLDAQPGRTVEEAMNN